MYIWWDKILDMQGQSRTKHLRMRHILMKVIQDRRRQTQKRISMVVSCSQQCFYRFLYSAKQELIQWLHQVPMRHQLFLQEIHTSCRNSFWLLTFCQHCLYKQNRDFIFLHVIYIVESQWILYINMIGQNAFLKKLNCQNHTFPNLWLNRSFSLPYTITQLKCKRKFIRFIWSYLLDKVLFRN